MQLRLEALGALRLCEVVHVAVRLADVSAGIVPSLLFKRPREEAAAGSKARGDGVGKTGRVEGTHQNGAVAAERMEQGLLVGGVERHVEA